MEGSEEGPVTGSTEEMRGSCGGSCTLVHLSDFHLSSAWRHQTKKSGRHSSQRQYKRPKEMQGPQIRSPAPSGCPPYPTSNRKPSSLERGGSSSDTV